MQAMITAFKLSPYFQALMKCFFYEIATPGYDTCQPYADGSPTGAAIPGMVSSTYPSSVGYAYLGLAASIDNPWVMYLNSIYGPQYKVYSAFAKGGFLLKRDVSPASNNNSPMWLNDAA